MNAHLPHGETINVSSTAAAGAVLLRVFRDVRAVKLKWQALERDSPCTVYQSYAWCDTWLKTVGCKRGISPVIVVGETLLGETVFILPLQLRSWMGLKTVEALTAPQGAYAAAIFQPGFDAHHWLFEHFDAVVQALPRHHVFKLFDIPETVMGLSNPLLCVRHMRGANQSHVVDLLPDYDELFAARRSADTRRRIRKRDAKLEAHGAVHFGLPATDPETYDVLRSMFEHQKRRMAEIGVHDVYDERERAFIYSLGAQTGSAGPLLRPYRLVVDGKVHAVMLGAYFKQTYWGLITSLAPGDLQRYSPGDYALRALIRALCEDGTRLCDLSAGDTAYKFHWSNQRIPLHFIVRSTHALGLFWALGVVLREKIKRVAKSTPLLNSALFRLRQMLADHADAG